MGTNPDDDYSMEPANCVVEYMDENGLEMNNNEESLFDVNNEEQEPLFEEDHEPLFESNEKAKFETDEKEGENEEYDVSDSSLVVQQMQNFLAMLNDSPKPAVSVKKIGLIVFQGKPVNIKSHVCHVCSSASGLQFYYLPSDPKRAKYWLEKLNCGSSSSTENEYEKQLASGCSHPLVVICDAHSDIISDPELVPRRARKQKNPSRAVNLSFDDDTDSELNEVDEREERVDEELNYESDQEKKRHSYYCCVCRMNRLTRGGSLPANRIELFRWLHLSNLSILHQVELRCVLIWRPECMSICDEHECMPFDNSRKVQPAIDLTRPLQVEPIFVECVFCMSVVPEFELVPFPRDEGMRLAWLSSLAEGDSAVWKRAAAARLGAPIFLCSAHFPRDSWETSLFGPRLRLDAIPDPNVDATSADAVRIDREQWDAVSVVRMRERLLQLELDGDADMEAAHDDEPHDEWRDDDAPGYEEEEPPYSCVLCYTVMPADRGSQLPTCEPLLNEWMDLLGVGKYSRDELVIRCCMYKEVVKVCKRHVREQRVRQLCEASSWCVACDGRPNGAKYLSWPTDRFQKLLWEASPLWRQEDRDRITVALSHRQSSPALCHQHFDSDHFVKCESASSNPILKPGSLPTVGFVGFARATGAYCTMDPDMLDAQQQMCDSVDPRTRALLLARDADTGESLLARCHHHARITDPIKQKKIDNYRMQRQQQYW